MLVGVECSRSDVASLCSVAMTTINDVNMVLIGWFQMKDRDSTKNSVGKINTPLGGVREN